MPHKRAKRRPLRGPDTEERQKDVFLAAVARNGTINAGVRACGVPRDRLRRWLLDDLLFKLRFDEARDIFKEQLQERMVAAVRQGDRVTLRIMARGELPENSAPPRKSR